jgi:hypothetical protein
MSRVARRRITGRPWGQVVGEEVFNKRSISLRIFSGEKGMLTLMAAWQASEAELLVCCRTKDAGERYFYFNHAGA